MRASPAKMGKECRHDAGMIEVLGRIRGENMPSRFADLGAGNRSLLLPYQMGSTVSAIGSRRSLAPATPALRHRCLSVLQNLPLYPTQGGKVCLAPAPGAASPASIPETVNYSRERPRTSAKTSGRSDIRPSTPQSRSNRIVGASFIVHTCTSRPNWWAMPTVRGDTTRMPR